MKLTQVILPEILLGRRGHPKVIEFYKKQMNACHQRVDEDGFNRWSFPQDMGNGRISDLVTANHAILCRFWRDGNGKSYYLPREFAQALSQVDREIPVDVLPRGKRFVCHLQFAKESLQDDTGWVDGAIVALDTVEGFGYRDSTCKDQNGLAMTLSYWNIDEKNPEMGPTTVTKLSCALGKERLETLADAIKNHELQNGLRLEGDGWKVRRLPIYRAILNAVIYLFSADPEIMKLRPLGELTNSKRVVEKHRVPVHNELTVPISVLNWSYQGGRQYSVDSTLVRSHMRWQRCGVGFSEVKLILIEEHERHYKTDEKVIETMSKLNTKIAESWQLEQDKEKTDGRDREPNGPVPESGSGSADESLAAG